jgi:hypothetical protein
VGTGIAEGPRLMPATAGSWRAGESGNPGGRANDAEVAALARRYTVDAMRALVEVARTAYGNPSARVTAALGLLDRGWGKPRQDVSLTGTADSVHLHLFAVQQLNDINGVMADIGAPPIAAATIPTDMLPAPEEVLPHEALPLWEATRPPEAPAESKPEGEPP